jgi:hypothetical protein
METFSRSYCRPELRDPVDSEELNNHKQRLTLSNSWHGDDDRSRWKKKHKVRCLRQEDYFTLHGVIFARASTSFLR